MATGNGNPTTAVVKMAAVSLRIELGPRRLSHRSMQDAVIFSDPISPLLFTIGFIRFMSLLSSTIHKWLFAASHLPSDDFDWIVN